jgi:ribonuclease BN (tRNA processing enzyme)
MRVFTRSFLSQSKVDQAKVVAAIIHDLTVQNYLSKDDERKAHEQARRIAKKARELGCLKPGEEVRP